MLNVQSIIERHLPLALQGTWISKFITYVTAKSIKQHKINEFIEKHADCKGHDFVDAVLEYFNVNYQIRHKEKESIPASGRCIIAANHPLGGLDGLALLHLVLSIRGDVKIVANDILSNITELQEYILPINAVTGESSRDRLKAIHQCLQNDMAVIIFPAGEVSRSKYFRIRDRKWNKGFLSFAKNNHADIIPVFINGKNSIFFYIAAKIHRHLAAIMLPRQMWVQQNKTIAIKIGRPLPSAMLRNLPLRDKQIVAMLQKHTYRLKRGKKGLFTLPPPVSHPERRSDVKQAINASETLGRNNAEQRIVLYKPQPNSSLMREIGRLREITFRKVGEGSMKKRDLDTYDTYYEHLVIWHEDDLELMGAYRVTLAKPSEGKTLDHLYTNTLFTYSGDISWLDNGLELGRSFVQPRYWGSRSLDYLWQGIGAYYAKHPQIRYLFGTVSISDRYPEDAIEYLVAFYSHYFKNHHFQVQSNNPYQINSERREYYNKLFHSTDRASAYKQMKSYLSTMNLVVPTLFKHYSELCEDGGVTFTDFGIDPDFNNCVDGFVIVDLEKIKANKYKRYVAPFIS